MSEMADPTIAIINVTIFSILFVLISINEWYMKRSKVFFTRSVLSVLNIVLSLILQGISDFIICLDCNIYWFSIFQQVGFTWFQLANYYFLYVRLTFDLKCKVYIGILISIFITVAQNLVWISLLFDVDSVFYSNITEVGSFGCSLFFTLVVSWLWKNMLETTSDQEHNYYKIGLIVCVLQSLIYLLMIIAAMAGFKVGLMPIRILQICYVVSIGYFNSIRKRPFEIKPQSLEVLKPEVSTPKLI